MPVNKEALIRFRIIDNCLRNKFRPYPKLAELASACEEVLGKTFSQSTIQKDIYAMRFDEGLAYIAPIAFSKLEKGYYYEDPQYTIASVPLDQEDMNAIAFAAAILQQFKGVGLIDNYAFAIDKIFDSVNVKNKVGGSDDKALIQVEQAPAVPGHHWLGTLLESIKQRQVVHIEYRSYVSDQLKKYLLHPYVLKEYRNRWYVIGLDGGEQKVKTFGLDRIVNLENDISPYLDDPLFEPEKYFMHNIGITVGGLHPVTVELSFNSGQGRYVKSQPLHQSQEIILENDKELRVRLNVMINIELIMLIMSYGDNVVVLSPPELRQTIKENLHRALAKYP